MGIRWRYLHRWGASIGGKTGSGSDIDVSFDDLLSNFELGFMGAVGARKGKWSLMLDALYLDVKDSGSVTVSVDGFPLGVNGSLELTV